MRGDAVWRRWWRSEDGESLISAHELLLFLGFAAILLAVFFLQQGIGRGQWPTATAQVMSVQLECRMTVEGARRRYSNAPVPVIIPCDQVERFRADNQGRNWTLRRVYSGQVKVTGAAAMVTIAMDLSARDGGAPRVGDRFEVIQNPADAREISFADRSLSEILVAGSVGGLGVFLLAIAFFWF